MGFSTELIVNVDSAPLRLNGILLRDIFISSFDFQKKLGKHYQRQILQQGNP